MAQVTAYTNEGRYKCLQYGTICSNAGFLGNPIAEGIYGAEGLVLASVYLIPQRIMMWSSKVRESYFQKLLMNTPV